MEGAESLMAEIEEIDVLAYKSIPGFLGKLDDLDKKIKAYHMMDGIWKRFLLTQKVDLEELEAIKVIKTVCEKRTLAKYSYMTAYSHFAR